MNASTTARRIERVRHELHRREVQVARIEALGPHFVAITFVSVPGAEPTLAHFVSASFDDHLKFIFNTASGETVKRDYTPRRFDAERGELTVEFALHGHGLASEWARTAVLGQRATIGGPRGSMIIPTDFDWHLLVGDATALPAMHRRLEELPADARVWVLALVDDPADQRSWPHSANRHTQWVPTPDALVDAVRALALPPGEGFAWGAGEAALMVRVRDVLLLEHGHPREAMRMSAYWKQGVSEVHENLDA
jgi:NADPH-dependent ferric siderophore reductase